MAERHGETEGGRTRASAREGRVREGRTCRVCAHVHKRELYRNDKDFWRKNGCDNISVVCSSREMYEVKK
jgi:hypothetical protein